MPTPPSLLAPEWKVLPRAARLAVTQAHHTGRHAAPTTADSWAAERHAHWVLDGGTCERSAPCPTCQPKPGRHVAHRPDRVFVCPCGATAEFRAGDDQGAWDRLIDSHTRCEVAR